MSRISSRSAMVVVVLLPVLAAAGLSARATTNWARFRGPNGSGLSEATGVPTEFGPAKNLVWRLPLPVGYSSPILLGDRIYLTGVRDQTLLTMAIDRVAGKVIWERPAPARATAPVDKRNNPASPSPAVEPGGVYVFFHDYGLIAYDEDGAERWKVPLGPFDNIYGMGSSPVIVGNLIVLACDQSTGSFLLAVDKRTGREVWRTPRPEAKSGHATPIVWRAPDGKDQILLPGSFLLTAYDPSNGERIWWVRGLSFEIKSTPVISDGTLYINGYGAPENDPGRKIDVPAAETIWQATDTNGNGTIEKPEFPKYSAAFWFDVADLDRSGSLTTDEWEYYRAALDSENGMIAIRLGGTGDMTESAVRWKYQRAVPQLPSPLVFEHVLYMVNDGGIVTTLNPETGALIKQGRLTGALGAYFASPVAADGHLYFVSQLGAVAVLPPGGDLTPVVVNDLKEDAYATPAFADGRIYVRTVEALYAFGGAAGQ
ncbi:MAG: PQQ-binding-like beta-propeller repeat protein [Vicinamibacterales bacterium]